MCPRASVLRRLCSPSFRSGIDGKIFLWDLTAGKKIRLVAEHSEPVETLDFSQEGSILASGSSDNTVRLWDMKKCVAWPLL